MRISDWSSDVCSFDLIIAERAMIARIVGFDEDDRKADRLIGLRPDAQHLPVIFAQPVLDRSRFPRLHRERDADGIGRASWRKECVRKCRSRGSPYHEQKKKRKRVTACNKE